MCGSNLKREVGTDKKRNQNRPGRRSRGGSKGREKRGSCLEMSQQHPGSPGDKHMKILHREGKAERARPCPVERAGILIILALGMRK